MGITLREIIEYKYLGDATIIGGHNGLDREVRFVNVMEVPDIFNWVSPDELILTTAYPLKDNLEELIVLISKLNEKGVSALAIKPHRFIKELPHDIGSLADHLGFPVITLPSDAQFDKIIMEIFSRIVNEDYYIIKKTHEIHQTLTNLVLEGADFHGISKALANLCCGEVILKDTAHHKLAHARPTPLLSEPFSFDNYAFDIYEKEVRLKNEVIAYITLKSWRKIIEHEDIVAIDFAATIIAMLMFRLETNIEKEKRYRNDFLNGLIFHRIESAEWAVKKAQEFGLDLNIPYVATILKVGFLQSSSTSMDQNNTLNDLDKLIHHSPILHGVPCIYWSNTDGLVLLCPVKKNFPHDKKDIMSFCTEMKDFISKSVPNMAIAIGIGRYHKDILDISKSFEEAKTAVNIGRLVWGKNGVYHYNDLGIYQLLSQFTNEEQVNEYINTHLGSLIKYDHKKNSQLLLTLEHLLTGENIKVIAEKLFIHPKTISFRKNRIEEILDQSLENPEYRLSLLLALKLYHLHTN